MSGVDSPELRQRQPYPHPKPSDCKVEGMRDLWERGRAADLQVARNRVSEFDATSHLALMRFKITLLAWMDNKGYPPYLVPGAQTKTISRQEFEQREAAALLQVEEQKVLVRDHHSRVTASKNALVGSPMGLAALFPSNKFGLKVVKEAGQPTRLLHTDASTRFNQAAMDAARKQGGK